MAKVLVVGESWMTTSIHTKGFDSFTTVSYAEGVSAFLDALLASGQEVEFQPNHVAARSFPDPVEQLSGFDVVVLSDIGANTLLIPPDTFEAAVERPNPRFGKTKDAGERAVRDLRGRVQALRRRRPRPSREHRTLHRSWDVVRPRLYRQGQHHARVGGVSGRALLRQPHLWGDARGCPVVRLRGEHRHLVSTGSLPFRLRSRPGD